MGESSPRAATLARLRALVGARAGSSVPVFPDERVSPLDPGNVSTGIASLDTWLRGWPRPGPIEIVGRPGAGRLALVSPLFARLTREGGSVILVDPLLQVHPPGLVGVDLSRIVLVRPSPERAAWAAEQVARSGAIGAMVLVDAPPLGRSGVRLARAAEAGNVAVFILSERPEVDLPAVLRLEARGWHGALVDVRCTRSRDGRRLGERLVAVREPPGPLVEPLQAAAALHQAVGARGA